MILWKDGRHLMHRGWTWKRLMRRDDDHQNGEGRKKNRPPSCLKDQKEFQALQERKECKRKGKKVGLKLEIMYLNDLQRRKRTCCSKTSMTGTKRNKSWMRSGVRTKRHDVEQRKRRKSMKTKRRTQGRNR
jgi:hypothetical protein